MFDLRLILWQNRWENNGRTDSPGGSPSATDRVRQTHKFEVSSELDELKYKFMRVMEQVASVILGMSF